MTPEQGFHFLKALGAKNIKQEGKWIKASCPLAFALHKSHNDSNPSFGLNVEPNANSRYNCFACSSGSALDLIQSLEFYGAKNADFKLAREILESETLEVTPLPGYKEFSEAGEAWTLQPWPEWVLNDYPSVTTVKVAMDYLESRRVSKEEAIQAELKFDFTRAMICFPIRDAYGVLAGMRGRSILEGAIGIQKHYDYRWNKISNVRGVWYNEQALTLPGKTVVVEGQFDVLRVKKIYPKVVGNLTAKPTAPKIEKLASRQGVILIPDNDATGELSIKRYEEALSKVETPLQVLQLPKEVKDAGETHEDYLFSLLEPLLG